MTGLSALNLPQPLVWILAFAIIFGLLAAFAHLLKRIAGGRATELEGGRARVPRLGLVDSFDLDRHRKLLIVRRDNVEHLILVGPTDVVVESNIVRAAGATPIREDRQPLQAGAAPLANPAAGPIPGPAQPAPTAQPQRELPIPPVPAVPQGMPSPTVSPPVMPVAQFPIPQPTRSPEPNRKSTMPPPPPFGAPKRGPNQPAPQRVEPVLAPIVGGTPTPEKAQAAASPQDLPNLAVDKPEAKPAAENVPAPAATDTAASASVAEKAIEPAPAIPTLPVPPAPVMAEKADRTPTAVVPELPPLAAAATPQSAKPAEPVVAQATAADPLLADLSSKLQDVLKANIKPEPAATAAPAAAAAPRPPLPPLPPLAPEKVAAPQPQPAAKPAVTEIVHTPEAPAEAAPPAPPVDAFEEELRRILGRAPQKG